MKKQLYIFIVSSLCVTALTSHCADMYMVQDPVMVEAAGNSKSEYACNLAADSINKGSYVVHNTVEPLSELVDAVGREVHFGATYAASVLGSTLAGLRCGLVAKAAALSYIGLSTLPKAWRLGFGRGGGSLLAYDLVGFVVRAFGAEAAAYMTKALLGLPTDKFIVSF